MKKLFALLLAALMVVSLVACSDKKDDGKNDLDDYQQEEIVIDHITDKDGNTFYFDTVDSLSVKITKYVGGDKPHALQIPEKLDGKTVVAIDDQAFFFCSNITAIEIPATVTSIGAYAFAGCIMIESLTIPASVATIGDAAFYGCDALKTVTFAETSTLKAIPYAAFKNCIALEAVTIPAYINTIAQGAFHGCVALASVEILGSAEDGVEVIGAQAFQDCDALATLKLPASVVSIGSYAFSGSENLYLDGVTVPEGSYAATYIANMKLDQSAPQAPPAAPAA